jgi:hypothetical protein
MEKKETKKKSIKDKQFISGKNFIGIEKLGIERRQELSTSLLLLRHELRARLLDFSVAPFADPIDAPPGSARGVACVAPEQFQGETPDLRTDQFSVALLLLEMLAALPDPNGGTGAYRGRADVSQAVWRASQRALSADRAARYPAVRAFAAAVAEAWDVPDPVDAPPPRPEVAAPPAAVAAVTTAAPEVAPEQVIRLYDDEAIASRYQYSTAARVDEVPAAPPVFVAAAYDTAEIDEHVVSALRDDGAEEVGGRTVALPHGPAAIARAQAAAEPEVEEPAPEERTVAMMRAEADDPLSSRTVGFDAAALFHDGVPDGLSTMRANRDPKALMEMTRRFRAEAGAKAAERTRKATVAGPDFARPPTRPEPAAAPPAPKPTASLAPPRAAPQAPAPAPEGSRRVLTAVLSMLLAFIVALGVVFAIFRARR